MNYKFAKSTLFELQAVKTQSLTSTKSPSYADLVRWLKAIAEFPPLKIAMPASFEGVRDSVDPGPNGIIQLSWRGKSFEFGVNCEPEASPKSIALAATQIRKICRGRALHPLLVTPYLSESQLDFLQAEGVSGLDMCGNGVVILRGRMLVYRTGHPNRFPRGAPIKNVYAGTSSIVARAFLLRPRFSSVGAVHEFIEEYGGHVTLSTVSKVCTRLEEDLVITRKRDRGRRSPTLQTLQPDKLLDNLAENYVPPSVTRLITGRCKISGSKQDIKGELGNKLLAWSRAEGGRIVRAGEGSVEVYAVMAREPILSYYCSDADSAFRSLGDSVQETTRFINFELRETRDEFVYFYPIGMAASPIQFYLEFMNGDKRDKETAEQVRRYLLNELADFEPKEEGA